MVLMACVKTRETENKIVAVNIVNRIMVLYEIIRVHIHTWKNCFQFLNNNKNNREFSFYYKHYESEGYCHYH